MFTLQCINGKFQALFIIGSCCGELGITFEIVKVRNTACLKHKVPRIFQQNGDAYHMFLGSEQWQFLLN